MLACRTASKVRQQLASSSVSGVFVRTCNCIAAEELGLCVVDLALPMAMSTCSRAQVYCRGA